MSEQIHDSADSFEVRMQRLVDPDFFELDRHFFRDELRRGVRRFFLPLTLAARALRRALGRSPGARTPSPTDALTGETHGVVVPKPARPVLRGYSIRKR